MSAYIIIHATIKNNDLAEEYAGIVAPSVTAAGGELISGGDISQILVEKHGYDKAIVIRFPSKAAARMWYKSDEYLVTVPMRKEAMDAIFMLAEDPKDKLKRD